LFRWSLATFRFQISGFGFLFYDISKTSMLLLATDSSSVLTETLAYDVAGIGLLSGEQGVADGWICRNIISAISSSLSSVA
jgi:hypothetical protein